jgi:hypothetical protein
MSIQRFRLSTTLTALMLIIQIALAACNMPATSQSPTPDANAIRTSAAQTIQAGGAQQTNQAQSTQQANQTQAARLTAEAPQTEPPVVATTPPSSPLPGPPSPAVTSPPLAPGVPTINVSVDTNCRLGPSTDYDIISLLAVGQTTTVHGRVADNTWWYIADPRRAGQYCWMWGQYAIVNGDVASIPVVAAPPTPTYVAGQAEFVAAFSNIHSCGGVDVAVFQITNTSEEIFRSVHLVIKDPLTGLVIGEEESNAPFMGSGADCPPGLNQLAPGKSAFIASPIEDILAIGADARAIITICLDQNLEGGCAEVRVNFEIP